MVENTEYYNVFKMIPKLFCYNYSSYIRSEEDLFNPKKTHKTQNDTHRFSNFCISEKLFWYLKSGLEISEDVYKERREKISKSDFKNILQRPLLKIFEQRKFIDTDKKTPELYFETYKEIINEINPNSPPFDKFKTVAPSNEKFKLKIREIMLSKNLGENDLVYINFNLKSVNLLDIINTLTNKRNFLFNRLFDSDLNSHFVDWLLAQKNRKTYDFIERVIKTEVSSGTYYIMSRKFDNGVEVLEWFKAYMLIELEQSPENYAVTTLRNSKKLKTKFLSYGILQPKIIAMLKPTKDSLCPMILPVEFNATLESSQSQFKRKFSNPADYQQSKASNSEDETALSACSDSMERKRLKDKDVFQSFEGYEKAQHEYHPLQGTCVNLMNGEKTEVSSPGKEERDCPKDFFSKSEFQLSFFFNHSDTEKDLPFIKLHKSGEVELLFKKFLK